MKALSHVSKMNINGLDVNDNRDVCVTPVGGGWNRLYFEDFRVVFRQKEDGCG